MGVTTSFIPVQEQTLAEEFSAQGYVIRPVDDREGLDALRDHVVRIVCEQIGMAVPNDATDFLNHVDRIIPVERLNEVRLNTYRKMNAATWFRPTYFGLARSIIEALVGNELAMQNRINLSIQFPKDNSSLLEIHADVFGGETPFQVVEWLPLVDCYNTKSMFILPRAKSEAVYKRFADYGKEEFVRRINRSISKCTFRRHI